MCVVILENLQSRDAGASVVDGPGQPGNRQQTATIEKLWHRHGSVRTGVGVRHNSDSRPRHSKLTPVPALAALTTPHCSAQLRSQATGEMVLALSMTSCSSRGRAGAPLQISWHRLQLSWL